MSALRKKAGVKRSDFRFETGSRQRRLLSVKWFVSLTEKTE
jgi:hypothetical protein